jgi:hypothetical protein
MQLKCLISSSSLQKLIIRQLDEFYSRRISKLSGLDLKKTLMRKNPYLFKAVGTNDATEIVKGMLAAYMSSSDEGIFGDAFFEPIAKEICSGSYSPSPGVDIVVEDDHEIRAYAIKSGPSVFNSQSRAKQLDQFNKLRARLQKGKKAFDAVVGYSYGRRGESKGGFREVAGQELWEELTGDPEFYLKLVTMMQDRPIKHRTVYEDEFVKAVNRFVRDFTIDFCNSDGSIKWEELVRFNSGKEAPKRAAKKAKKVKS